MQRWLSAGRYAVRLHGPVAAPITIGLRLTRLHGWIDPDPPSSDDD